jgi:hypothetical protein
MARRVRVRIKISLISRQTCPFPVVARLDRATCPSTVRRAVTRTNRAITIRDILMRRRVFILMRMWSRPTRFTHLEISWILLQTFASAQMASFWFRTHRLAEHTTVTHGLEQQQSARDDHRSRFAIISGPASQLGTNPGTISQRSTFVRVPLPCGAAFEGGANRLQGRAIGCIARSPIACWENRIVEHTDSQGERRRCVHLVGSRRAMTLRAKANLHVQVPPLIVSLAGGVAFRSRQPPRRRWR